MRGEKGKRRRKRKKEKIKKIHAGRSGSLSHVLPNLGVCLSIGEIRKKTNLN
jgi:hypothetical protein